MGLERDWSGARAEDAARLVEPPQRLTSQQKAAVIVRLLLGQQVSPGLDRLSPEMQARLARAMASLGPISRATPGAGGGRVHGPAGRAWRWVFGPNGLHGRP